jgi:hypothetical protein
MPRDEKSLAHWLSISAESIRAAFSYLSKKN